jgi:hypothetical protein
MGLNQPNVIPSTNNAGWIFTSIGDGTGRGYWTPSVRSATLGFYGALPVPQAAAPTTLANVITILTNLGLCA